MILSEEVDRSESSASTRVALSTRARAEATVDLPKDQSIVNIDQDNDEGSHFLWDLVYAFCIFKS